MIRECGMLQLKLILLAIAIFCSTCFAANDFKSVNFPSENALELPISIQQDINGQIWLTSDASISLFTSDKFIQYKHFDLTSPIVSSVVLAEHFLIATQEGIFLSSKQRASEARAVWQDLRGNLNSLHQSDDNLVIVTEQAVYTVNSAAIETAKPTQLYNLSQPVLSVQVSNNKLLVLMGTALLSTDLTTGITSRFKLANEFVQIVMADKEVYALRKDSQLAKIQFSDNQIAIQQLEQQADALVIANQDIYALQGNTLSSINRAMSDIRLPFVTEQLYFDSERNLWLLSPYDAQVLWQQNIELIESEDQGLGRFEAVSSEYALQNDSLYLYDKTKQKWQIKTKLPEIAGSKEIITTNSAIWFVSADKLIGLDKQTLVQVIKLSLFDSDLVLKTSENKLTLISEKSIVELDAKGTTHLVKSCELTCLPNYNVNAHLLQGVNVLLATNQGLHKYDTNSKNFSSERLDKLNALSAIVGLSSFDQTSVWLLYPNKIALFNSQDTTSEIYYSDNNRLFSIYPGQDGRAFLFSQKGWFNVQKVMNQQLASNTKINLHKVTEGERLVRYLAPESILELTDTEQELRLAFNLSKQHSEQAVYVRFKYQDEDKWSLSSQLSQSITLKDLRQGKNSLLMQARLEGQNWGEIRAFNYQMPYKYLQTKWVLFYASLTLLIVAVVYLIERYKRFKIAFDTLKKETFIDSLLESTKDGVWVANKDREITSVNQAFCEITQFTDDDVMQQSFQITDKDGRNRELESLIWQEVIKTGFWTGEVWSKKKTGEDVSLDLSVTRVETFNKVVNKKDIRYVGVFSDVTDRKNSEKALRKLATRDPLTELANRTLYIELIEQAIATANPANPSFALMFIDLDNFSKVNANLGPIQGDELLKQVSQRLTSSLERGISVARLTADEFALLIPNHLLSGEPSSYIRRLSSEIKRLLQPSFTLANTEVNMNASIGIALYPQHGISPEALMRCADTALKKVKQSGRNNFIIYAKDLDDDDSELLSLEAELIRAFDNDEFKVYFQPKYLVQQHFVSGYEALVRWDSPSRGIVSPEKFIGLAEQNGLIRQLDSAVLKKVCKQVVIWQKQGIELGKVAVNISALNFQQHEFCQAIQQIVREHGVASELIELEITESAMMSDPEQTLANLNELRSLGFSIALDDFGTGHSSLGHLKYFPIDRIKIDRSFVKDIENSDQDKNITSVIIQLAKHLNMKVIAEGVENQSQAYILHILGCNEIQGYFISKPLPADEVVPFLQEKTATLPDIALD